MQVDSLDHVNLVARDLSATVAFYRDMLGLAERDPPPPLDPAQIRWLHDAAGRAIVHLASMARMAGRTGYPARVGRDTGSVDHVAFACTGLEEMRARFDAAGIAYRMSGVAGIGVVQLFVCDPDNVQLELNFRGG